MKTELVILFYKNWHFLLQMLERTPQDVNITIVHNLSQETEGCVDILNQWVKIGLIKRHILFHENVANNAIRILAKDGLLNFDSDYVIVSDADLLPDRGWLEEQTNILQNNADVFVVGSDLYTHNLPSYGVGWIPNSVDRGGYLEGNFGGHFMMFRNAGFKQWMDYMLLNGLTWCDTNIHAFGQNILKMKSAKTKNTKSYHFTWDLYNDLNHPYTKERLENTNIWNQNKESTYEVFE